MNRQPRQWRIVHSEASTGWGGQEHRVMAELTGFQRRGCPVWLLAPGHAHIVQRAEEQRIPVRLFHLGKLQFPFAVWRTARWLRQIRAEVVNTHSSRDGWLVGLAARLARTPLVMRTRHIDVDYPNPFVSGVAYKALADHVLTTSDKITQHFRDVFSLPADRISTVSTGIDLARFSPDGEKADWGLGPGPVAGMVSVLRSWKGHLTFLDAARQLADQGHPLRFVIVGAGPGQNMIAQRITELKLGDRVKLAGHREDVPAVLRALNVLAIPSTKHEGVPQIGLQALAAKTPVVGSNAGGIPEIIRPGQTGRLFPAGEAAALAVALRETLAARDLTRLFTEQGRVMVEAQHSREAMLDRLDALYRRYLEGAA